LKITVYLDQGTVKTTSDEPVVGFSVVGAVVVVVLFLVLPPFERTLVVVVAPAEWCLPLPAK
jgi:hypothetical protein